MPSCKSIALALVTIAGAPAPLHAQIPHSVQERADTMYECATAMIYAEKELGEPFRFSSRVLFDEFDDLVKQGADRTIAAAFAKEQFELFTKGKSRAGADDYIVDLARDCEQLMIQREAIRIEKERAEASARPITVDYLREHFRTNRNLPVIVEYILGRYPSGKSLMGDPIPEGEFLAELLLHVGKEGMKALPDSALVTIVNKQFWQYNPPASKLADAEYRRRLRARKYSQNEAKAWASRVEDERRRDLRRAATSTAQRLGGNIRCTNVAPQGLEGKSYNRCELLD